MDNPDELKHTVSGFYAYENFINQIPESSIDELNHIVQNLLKDPKTVETLSFITKVEQHIRDKDGHHLDISEHTEEMIFQLYQVYRDAGYTGSVKDMLIAIEKDIEVATHVEMVEGWNETKAVNVVEWRWRLDKHQKNKNAHKELLDSFRPQYALNIDPVVAYHYQYNKFIDKLVDIPVPYWDALTGTINIEYCFSINKPFSGDIFSAKLRDNHEFHIHLDIEKGKHVIVTCVYDNYEPLATFEYKAPFTPVFVNRLSFSYSRRRISIRDVFKSFIIPTKGRGLYFKSFSSDMTLGQGSNQLRSIAIYRDSTSVTEQNFFLN